MLFNSASVLVTEDCNLRCTYCFEDHKKNKMTIEVAETMLLWLFDNESKQGGQQVSITLFGGEPCLNAEVCVYLIKRGYELRQQTGIGFNANMITNCTFLPDEIADVFKEYMDKCDLSVQLSIDGTPDVQDEYRLLPNGGGSWAMVEKTIPKWKEVFKDRPGSLNIHGCLNKKTIHNLFESYKFFKYELNIPRIWFAPVCEEDWDMMDVAVYKAQNGMIYQDIMGHVRRSGSDHPLMDVAPFDKAQNICSTIQGKPCAAGDTYCCVTANGDIYPCHQFYYHELGYQMKLGSLDGGVDYERARLFQEYDGADLSCDKNCDHGGCYRCIAVNWDINTSILTQRQGVYCDIMKVDQYYQKLISEEMGKMGIKDNMSNEKCGQHTSDASGGCDVVMRDDEVPGNPHCKGFVRDHVMDDGTVIPEDDYVEDVSEKEAGHSCNCGSGGCGDKGSDYSEVLATILIYQKNIMRELQDLKVQQEVRKRSEK